MTARGTAYKDGEGKISGVLIEMAKPFIQMVDESTVLPQTEMDFCLVFNKGDICSLCYNHVP